MGVVDLAVLSKIFELDTDAPSPYGFSSELIGSFFKSARETITNMRHGQYAITPCIRRFAYLLNLGLKIPVPLETVPRISRACVLNMASTA
jgi:hypothetical protein